jgi:peptidoglycan hydrolase CwlO-like protein
LENAQQEQDGIRQELERHQSSVQRIYSERDKAAGEIEKLREELERTQATLGKSQLQQEKIQNGLDKATSDVEHLQDKLEKATNEIRRVRNFFKILEHKKLTKILIYSLQSKKKRRRTITKTSNHNSTRHSVKPLAFKRSEKPYKSIQNATARSARSFRIR